MVGHEEDKGTERKYRDVSPPRAFDAPEFEEVDVAMVCRFIEMLDSNEALLLVRWIGGEYSEAERKKAGRQLKSILSRWKAFKIENGLAP